MVAEPCTNFKCDRGAVESSPDLGRRPEILGPAVAGRDGVKRLRSIAVGARIRMGRFLRVTFCWCLPRRMLLFISVFETSAGTSFIACRQILHAGSASGKSGSRGKQPDNGADSPRSDETQRAEAGQNTVISRKMRLAE